MGTITLVPLPGSAASDLPRLGELVGEVFHRRVVIARAWRSVQFAFDVSRAQHSSRAILAALLQPGSAAGERVLGVTGVDLFMPVLTFVFGEAQLGGRAAVVSTCRLDPPFYGLPPDAELLQERLEKEAIHELGHTFGLLHCRDNLCVMRSSTYAEELDSKNVGFCAGCLERVTGGRGAGSRRYQTTTGVR